MSDVITSREDVFLGKIAGRNVDISSWTPPVANGVHEEILAEIADRIDNLSENALPEIEEGDEGKVVGVADGAYALVSGGGGGGGNEPLIVNLVYGDTTYLDKTYAEIKTALLAGTPVYCLKDDSWDDPDSGYTEFTYGTIKNIIEHTSENHGETSHYDVTFNDIGPFTANEPNGTLVMAE